MKVTQLCPTICNPMDCPWNSPGQNTGVGSLSLLQGIFPTQGSNPGLPRCRRILYQLSHKGSPDLQVVDSVHLLTFCRGLPSLSLWLVTHPGQWGAQLTSIKRSGVIILHAVPVRTVLCRTQYIPVKCGLVEPPHSLICIYTFSHL